MTKNQISHLRQHNRLTGENNKYFIVYISEFQTKTCWRDPHTHFQCLTDSWFMVIVVLKFSPDGLSWFNSAFLRELRELI